MRASTSADDAALVQALVETGRWLREHGYRFTAVTPATHGRVSARPGMQVAKSVRDVFGWSRPFDAALLPEPLIGSLRCAGLVDPAGDSLLRSAVRFASLGNLLFAHSAYPTTGDDAVFFGPDTYRFAALIAHELERRPLDADARILDVCCGAGPGGLLARQHANVPTTTVLADISPRALCFAHANACLAGAPSGVELLSSDLFAHTSGEFDLIVANPPYLNDSAGRTYRHGGGRWGEALALRIVREGLTRLAPGGRLVLYTGVPMIDGADPLWTVLRGELAALGWPCHYRELDPDVFGEELSEPAYAEVERIAAVALVVERPKPSSSESLAKGGRPG